MKDQEDCQELLFDALQDLVFESTIDKISVKHIVEGSRRKPVHLLQAFL